MLQLFLSLIAGSLLPLAFAPFEFYPLAIICPAVLLWLWLHGTTKQAFWRGYLFGLGFFGVGVSWVYISIHQFGGANIALAFFITALMIGFLALFPATQGYLLTRFFSRNNIFLAFPALWVLLEWLRSWIFTGFPWLLLGASQTPSPLRGFAPLIGEYGLAFLVTLSSALLVLIIINKKFLYRLFIIFLLLLIWLSGFFLTKIHWTQPQGKPIKVALVQGDIPQQLKWTPEYVQLTLQRYYQFTQQHWDSDLIIWPETAVPLLQTQAQDFLSRIDREAKQHHATLITGIPIQQNFNYYNAMMVLGKGQGVYLKRHLVPFGEYVPLLDWLGGVLGFLNIPMSDLSAGPLQQPLLQADSFTIAPFVCYEIVYEQLALQDLPKANLLITVSNDAWFGHSFAAAQHLQIGQLRALETGRYHLFVTNSGITAIIDPQGKIQAALPSFQSAVLTGVIQPMIGVTPIAEMGIIPVIVLMFVLLIVVFGFRKKW
jgi:apolipoprotein N-acyltransferase